MCVFGDEAVNLCREFADRAPDGVIFPEPYLPYVPAKWNGVLVLAEAQNLGNPEAGHVLWLEGLPPEERIKRLYIAHSLGQDLGVGPWDNGITKLALKAMTPNLCLNKVAVSNAVPWSCRGEGVANVNPTAEMKDMAVDFWRELFAIWRPELKALILLGKVASDVMTRTGAGDDALELRLPVPQNLYRSCGMFDQGDLLTRFPEVRRAADELGVTPNLSEVFFACHAVSLGKQRFEDMF